MNEINKEIFDEKQQNVDDEKFKYSLNEKEMKSCLSFIHSWNGLTSQSKIPSNFKNYRDKSRNWLNGRRSKVYGNTLFYDMICESQKV